MIQTCDGHSFDDSLLTPGGWALDVGARGFKFADAMADRGLNVIAMEPDRGVQYEGPHRIDLRHVALVGQPREASMYAGWSTGEGNHLSDTRPEHATEFYSVPCVTLSQLMTELGIEQFDIVKLDCEGAEYDILWNWPSRAAKQISVEHHDFLGRNPCHPDVERFYRELFAGPLTEYEVIQHEWRPLSAENPVMNYWDDLYVLKPEFRA